MATRTASCPYENTAGRLPHLLKHLTSVTVMVVRTKMPGPPAEVAPPLLDSVKG
ncbi:hypothetical protein [Streptomyces sp. NPDC005262]|uniref:hypothetical protein n=1 Tax=Streptomyces sp. NPDC005262 TaxID=3364710 RepID=UPI00368AD9E5